MSKAGTTPVRQSLIGDCAAAFVLLSRLPTGWYRFPTDNPPNFTSALWAFPVVGLVIGGAAGLVLSGAVALSLPPLAAAALAIFASLLLSGAMHEDGLADMADGFGGGMTPTPKSVSCMTAALAAMVLWRLFWPALRGQVY